MKTTTAAELETSITFDSPEALPAEQFLGELVPESSPSDQPESSPESKRAKQEQRKAKSSRVVSLLGGKLNLDAYQHPILGSPEAQNVIVELMDYGCPNCRAMHKTQAKARKRYGDQLAILVLPTPNEILCNQYIKKANPRSRGSCRLARLAVSVAETDPAEFERIHNFLMEGAKKPSFTRSLLFAKEHMDGQELSRFLRSEESEDRVKNYIELYAKLSKTRGLFLPCQIIDDKLIEGSPPSVEAFCDAWEEQLSIKPLD